MIHKLTTIILTLLVYGCNQQNIVDVVHTNYPNGKVWDPEPYELEIKKEPDGIDYFYRLKSDSADIYQYIVTLFPTADSIILYGTDTARLIGQKQYDSDVIKKYLYDRKDSSDEELYLYLLDGIGLVGHVEIAWDGYMLINHPGTDVEQKLKDDDTGFFYKRIR